MTVHSQGTGIGHEGSRNRNRRAHKKSRRGCRNCKLRRTKVSHTAGMWSCKVESLTTDILLECDETRPECKKCTTFRVSCNYDSTTPDLQMAFDGTAMIKSPPKKPPCSINQPLRGMMEVPVPACLYPVIISDDKSAFQLDGQSLDRLGRFHMRTALTIGNKRGAALFQNVIMRLACSVSDAHAN